MRGGAEPKAVEVLGEPEGPQGPATCTWKWRLSGWVAWSSYLLVVAGVLVSSHPRSDGGAGRRPAAQRSLPKADYCREQQSVPVTAKSLLMMEERARWHSPQQTACTQESACRAWGGRFGPSCVCSPACPPPGPGPECQPWTYATQPEAAPCSSPEPDHGHDRVQAAAADHGRDRTDRPITSALP